MAARMMPGPMEAEAIIALDVLASARADGEHELADAITADLHETLRRLQATLGGPKKPGPWPDDAPCFAAEAMPFPVTLGATKPPGIHPEICPI